MSKDQSARSNQYSWLFYTFLWTRCCDDVSFRSVKAAISIVLFYSVAAHKTSRDLCLENLPLWLASRMKWLAPEGHIQQCQACFLLDTFPLFMSGDGQQAVRNLSCTKSFPKPLPEEHICIRKSSCGSAKDEWRDVKKKEKKKACLSEKKNGLQAMVEWSLNSGVCISISVLEKCLFAENELQMLLFAHSPATLWQI